MSSVKIPEELEKRLKNSPADLKVAENFLKRARKDLLSAKRISSFDMEVAYTLLYDSMLRAGLAFMAVSGVRPEIVGKHKTVIGYMGYVLGKEYQDQVEFYDRMRKKRHFFIYEPGRYDCTEKEMQEAEKMASEFLNIVANKVRELHPQKEWEF